MRYIFFLCCHFNISPLIFYVSFNPPWSSKGEEIRHKPWCLITNSSKPHITFSPLAHSQIWVKTGKQSCSNIVRVHSVSDKLFSFSRKKRTPFQSSLLKRINSQPLIFACCLAQGLHYVSAEKPHYFLCRWCAVWTMKISSAPSCLQRDVLLWKHTRADGRTHQQGDTREDRCRVVISCL